MPAAANNHAGENLDAFLVTFDDLGVDTHGIADLEFAGLFPILF